ncbi:organelle RRM domain-containing protein 2, mitochondrial-like isoform X2 [Hibiscus syriacus]|nr:organelle RRM domain-containing protein 2, mitochondrial-like isoform X2 [Hibiscus syriacus]
MWGFQGGIKMAVRSGNLSPFFSTNSSLFHQPLAAAAVAAKAARVAEQIPPSTTLFVSGLSGRTTNQKLREAFANFGDVIHAKVVNDRSSLTNHCKGYGFVRYSNIEDAEKAIKRMNGQFLDGRVIFAEYAKPKDTTS